VTRSKRSVVLAVAAVEDFASIVDHYLEHVGVDVAIALDRKLTEAIASLSRFPDRGRPVPELRSRGLGVYREVITGPYRIMYRSMGRAVWVVAIVDGRRDLDELLQERARRDESGRLE
jgi:toxin ParE1/3/4